MIQLGQQYDQLPGEWFGPTTASLVMRDLAVVQQRCLDGNLCVHVAPSDVVYIDDIESICGPLQDEAPESGGADKGGVTSSGGGGGGGGDGSQGGDGGAEVDASEGSAQSGADAHSEGAEETKGTYRTAPANVAVDVAAVAEEGTAPATAGASLLPSATATDPLATADPLSAGNKTTTYSLGFHLDITRISIGFGVGRAPAIRLRTAAAPRLLSSFGQRCNPFFALTTSKHPPKL
jgi:hypothetical protein